MIAVVPGAAVRSYMLEVVGVADCRSEGKNGRLRKQTEGEKERGQGGVRESACPRLLENTAVSKQQKFSWHRSLKNSNSIYVQFKTSAASGTS